jgi:hypothetical protein
LFDWLSNVGGLAKTILAVFLYISSIFSQQIFTRKVLKNLFISKDPIFNIEELKSGVSVSNADIRKKQKTTNLLHLVNSNLK